MKLKIIGLDCPNCAKTLENAINKSDCIINAKIDFFKGIIEFESNNKDKAIQTIIDITKQIEPEATIVTSNQKHNKNILLDITILILGLLLSFTCLFTTKNIFLYWILFSISAILLGYKTFYKAIKLLFKGIINENLLLTISVIGAAIIGEHMESLMVIGLYSIGKVLESIAVNKSKKSIEELTKFRPEFAIILKDNQEIMVKPDEVNINDIIIVRPGERISLDGVIVNGIANLDMQNITGESLPVSVSKDSEVISGSIVLDGVLEIKVTTEYNKSTVNTIIDLIETATENKSKTETFITKITKWYTLGVIILSIIVFLLVYTVTNNSDTAIYRGLIFLVISCPCAFAISVPLTYFSGLGNASKNGILIKGSNYLDACARLNMIAFDKTGTLTNGDFAITNISSYSKKYGNDDILYIAALGEQYSLHPLAKSITHHNRRPLSKVENFKEISGLGISYNYNNKYFIGKNKDNNNTSVEIYENDIKIGEIYFKDNIKEEAKSTCEQLSDLNIKKVILSGDKESVVKQIAKEINIDEYYFSLLPQDKFNWIKENKESNIIGYVGDGLNDAPSLALSDIGFCMGIKGNNASIEAADIIIANDNLNKIPLAINISKYTRKIVWQNIIFSALIKILFLTLGALGITGMLSAVVADVGVTLLAILNSLRALDYNKKRVV